MNQIIHKYRALRLCRLAVLLAIFTAYACNDDNNSASTAPIKITKVFLEDARSEVPDREVEFARLGQTIRIEGEGFTGISKVVLNGYSCYFNPVMVTEHNIVMQISRNVPTLDAAENVRNTIVIERGTDKYSYNFEIRSAAPSVTGVSNTMPSAGSLIRLTGTGLQHTSAVTFPGNIKVTSGITSDDEDGKWVEVTVPEGVSEEGGYLTVICANGGAYSPAYFNCRKNVIQNFDDINNYAWASGIDGAGTPLTDVIPATGDVQQSQGGYMCFNPTGKSISANADVRYWTNSDNWSGTLTTLPGLSAATATNACGVQMDIYVVGTWNTGIIRMVMADGSGTERYCMTYNPWWDGNAVVPFTPPAGWYTITMPFSTSADYEGKTLGDVVASMQAASYKQSGPWFHNIGIKDVYEPVATDVKIYFDNIRVVPLNTPTYDEFAE